MHDESYTRNISFLLAIARWWPRHLRLLASCGARKQISMLVQWALVEDNGGMQPPPPTLRLLGERQYDKALARGGGGEVGESW